MPDARAIAADPREIASEHEWYHSIELAPGVVTPGMFDHGPHVFRYGLPEDLSGARALDVGTFDGFWAFELERRGAEVTALDVPLRSQLDWPPHMRPDPEQDEERGGTFRAAAAARGSRADWVGTSIYDASPAELGGTFDLVFCGSILIHLRDPMLALERMAQLCSGRLVLAEEYPRLLERIPRLRVAQFRGDTPYMTWWRPTTRAWMAMVRTAGFRDVEHRGRFNLPPRAGGWRGVPHTVIHARSD